MQDLLNFTLQIIRSYALGIGIGSALIFAISLASVPYIIAQIPVDYFTHHGRHRMSQSNHHPAIRLVLTGFKNMLGGVMLIAGFIMLFTPGQGLLTILFGLIVMNYPGKYRLECRIIRQPLIFNALNTMRRKQGKEPLLPPE
ncbi:MAG: PGPGW domain-containing protein [Mariprofundaceae bacterium]|nr:PGPGW domain-containing protein [Mariprofundaceae bacterium]